MKCKHCGFEPMSEGEIRKLKEVIGQKFCWYKYEPDKAKWLHPDIACLPACIGKEIDKALSGKVGKETSR